MMPFIEPPKHTPWYLKFFIWLGQKIAGQELMPAKLLAWFPRGFFASMFMEGLAARAEKDLDGRILKLVRLTVSFSLSCPFCIDMNSAGLEKFRITAEEMEALRERKKIHSIPTFSRREKLAIEYVYSITRTPLNIPENLVTEMKNHFNEKEFIVMASTAAQVNYWSRFIQALGILPLCARKP